MNESDFFPIRVSSLRGDIKIPFDVYVRVAGKYIHYCRQGDSFEGKRLNKLKEKKLQKVFILRVAENDFLKYLAESMDSAYDPNSKKTLDIRAQVIQGHQQSLAEDFMEQPNNADFCAKTLEASERFIKFLGTGKDTLKSICDIENVDNNIGHHGVTVAAIAFNLAKHLKLDDTMTLPFLVMGALIHDVEHLHTHFQVAGLRSNFSAEELKVYHRHPRDGAVRFNDMIIHPLVQKIVLQHEEAADGSGFPSRIKGADLDPQVMVVAVANAFDRVVTFEGKRPKDALRYLLIDKLGVYPLPYLMGLQEVLKWGGVLLA